MTMTITPICSVLVVRYYFGLPFFACLFFLQAITITPSIKSVPFALYFVSQERGSERERERGARLVVPYTSFIESKSWDLLSSEPSRQSVSVTESRFSKS